MTPTDQSINKSLNEPVTKAGDLQPEQLNVAQVGDDTDTTDRSATDVAPGRLLVEIQNVMFLPPADPTRIAVMAEKSRVLALIEAHQTRPS
jgi:hypothetical protein